jgi:diketogulonate reductase-like aldo/keto reductase
MRQERFGAAGVRLPVVGQGTWDMEKDDRTGVLAAIRRGLDLGMTHVDTAEMYGDGRVETIVGEAIEGRRDEVFLATKVLPKNASREGTIEACERSLRRLRTDRVDLYLLHWPSDHPFGETVAGFEALREAGKVVHWGVSNFAEDELDDAIRVAGPGKVACNQVLYHVAERAIEHAVVAACERNDVAIVAYSPLGSGDFPAPNSKGGRALAAVAKTHGATPEQVAIAFLLRRPSVFAIPKASRVEHVEANAGAGDLRLSDDDVERLDAAFPRGARRAGVPTL